jgi:hypothetical protein
LPRVRFWGVAAVLAAVVVAVLPGQASASAYVRYGVQDDAWLRYGPGKLDARLDRLETLGVDLVRVNLLWSEVEGRRGVFDWAAYDTLLKGLRARGIEPVLTLFSTPAWANGRRGTNWAPTSGAPFATFARKAALRYPYVRRWLVWNEPNQRRWLKPTSPSVYVMRLLNPAYAAIHAVRRNALVGGGVTAPRASEGGVSPVAWIRGMAAAHARLDAYAHNPYPLGKTETPFAGGCDHCETITMATLDRLLTETSRAFGPGKRIWFSEFGYQTSPPDPWLGVSWERQAQYVSEAAMRAFLAPRVDLLVQFLVRDEPELGRWQSGIVTVGGKAKPSYGALQIPLTVRARSGLTTTLWGQVRPGHGAQRYRLQRFSSGRWIAVGGTATTTRTGFFTRAVRAQTGSKYQVVQLSTGIKSHVLTVPKVAPTATADRQSLGG